MTKPTTQDQVWGRALLMGHVHAYTNGKCRCGAPFGNAATNRTANGPEAKPTPAPAVESEQVVR